MNLTLFVAGNCPSCERVKAQISNLIKNKTNINFYVEDLNQNKSRGLIIVPALFIEDELYSYGDIDEKKFTERIEKQIKN